MIYPITRLGVYAQSCLRTWRARVTKRGRSSVSPLVLGPCTMSNEGKLEKNPCIWARSFNIISIDQHVGVGFLAEKSCTIVSVSVFGSASLHFSEPITARSSGIAWSWPRGTWLSPLQSPPNISALSGGTGFISSVDSVR